MTTYVFQKAANREWIHCQDLPSNEAAVTHARQLANQIKVPVSIMALSPKTEALFCGTVYPKTKKTNENNQNYLG